MSTNAKAISPSQLICVGLCARNHQCILIAEAVGIGLEGHPGKVGAGIGRGIALEVACRGGTACMRVSVREVHQILA